MSSTLLPYIITIIVFFVGGLVGWWLGRRSSAKAEASADNSRSEKTSLQDARAELAQIETRLKHVNELKATAQQHLDEHCQEHSQLLLSLEEQRATVEEVRADLEAAQRKMSDYQQEINQLLADIDRRQQELEMLNNMKESVGVQADQLTQQVQRHDSRLRILRQTVRERSKEIAEMEALLEQRSATLRRLTGDRQRLDVDIAQAEQLLNQQTERLQQLLNRHPEPEPDHHHTEEHNRVDVTPRRSFRLPSQVDDSAGVADESDEDDLTVIPALADFYARQLKAGGVKLIAQLAYADPDEIRKLLRDVPGHLNPGVEGWILAAREILNERRNGGI